MIHCHVDGISLRLEEFHVHVSKKRRESDVNLCIGEIHADAVAGAFAEADEIVRKRLLRVGDLRVVKPAVGIEGVAGGKNAFVVVLNVGSQADGDTWWNGVGTIFNGRVKYTRESL